MATYCEWCERARRWMKSRAPKKWADRAEELESQLSALREAYGKLEADREKIYGVAMAWQARAEGAERDSEKLAWALESLASECEFAVAGIRRPKQGGQQVPYHGPFACGTPSTVRDLEAMAKRARGALANRPINPQQGPKGDPMVLEKEEP